jgi:hypothetical protein
VSIRHGEVKDMEVILSVINISNSEAYREIIPPEISRNLFSHMRSFQKSYDWEIKEVVMWNSVK